MLMPLSTRDRAINTRVNFIPSPACDPVITQTKLPPGCSLRPQDPENKMVLENGDSQTSFERAVCSMDECTTDRGTCKDKDAICCCRAQRVQRVNISCADTTVEKQLDPQLTKNATQCSCMSCDDVMVKVRLSVKGPGDDGPIAVAQIFDTETEDLIGLTLYNGILDFEVEVRKRKLMLLIQATGYQRVTRGITLSPKHTMIFKNITLARLLVANIGHGQSEVAFPLGKWVWLHAAPGSFHKNGTTHHHDVVFKGSYIDPTSSDIRDLIESEKFEVEGRKFAMLATVFLEFEDSEGETLDVKDLRLAVPLNKDDDLFSKEIMETFTAVHDWETGQWTKVSTFSPVKKTRNKRNTNPTSYSEIVLEAPDVSISQFLMIAVPIGADCWAQVRTFDQNQNPFPGPLVTVFQHRMVAGMEIVYVFSTNTGAQTTDNLLSPNAVCIPLDCNDFIEVQVFGRVEFDSLLAIPFPDNTFITDPGNPPYTDDTFFLFTDFTPADILNEPRPFYVFRENCITQGREPDGLTDPRDHFSFAIDYTPLPSTDQCYIKLTIRNCNFRSNTVTITSLDPQSGDINNIQSFLVDDMLVTDFDSGSGFSEECFDESQCLSLCSVAHPVCLPYNCSSIIQINITSNYTVRGDISTCELTEVSRILDDTILAFRGNTRQEDLTIDTSVLDPNSLNDVDLGLYYDPQPTAGRDLCRAGGDYDRINPPHSVPPMDITHRGTAREGSAAYFGCFTDST